jgi:hypothetical protein
MNQEQKNKLNDFKQKFINYKLDFLSDINFFCFLSSKKWDITLAEKQLKFAIAWIEKNNPNGKKKLKKLKKK